MQEAKQDQSKQERDLERATCAIADILSEDNQRRELLMILLGHQKDVLEEERHALHIDLKDGWFLPQEDISDRSDINRFKIPNIVEKLDQLSGYSLIDKRRINKKLWKKYMHKPGEPAAALRISQYEYLIILLAFIKVHRLHDFMNTTYYQRWWASGMLEIDDYLSFWDFDTYHLLFEPDHRAKVIKKRGKEQDAYITDKCKDKNSDETVTLIEELLIYGSQNLLYLFYTDKSRFDIVSKEFISLFPSKYEAFLMIVTSSCVQTLLSDSGYKRDMSKKFIAAYNRLLAERVTRESYEGFETILNTIDKENRGVHYTHKLYGKKYKKEDLKNKAT